jgi:hypothetical protein
MRWRVPLSFLILLCAGNASQAPSRPPSATSSIADATVETGRVFSGGGIDGLILYALVLSTFLMFLVAVAAVWLGHRSATRKTELTNSAFAAKDSLNADQTRMFIESMDRTAAAVSSLAVSVASDLPERAAQAATLARIGETDVEIRALLAQLNRAP